MTVALEALGRGAELLAAVNLESLSVRDRLEALDALETASRRIRSGSYATAASLDRCGDQALGGA